MDNQNNHQPTSDDLFTQPQQNTDTMSSEQAVALARAKLKAIYGDSHIETKEEVEQEGHDAVSSIPTAGATPQNTQHAQTPQPASVFKIPKANTPEQEPLPTQKLFEREVQLQDTIDPTHKHINPDHALHAGTPQQTQHQPKAIYTPATSMNKSLQQDTVGSNINLGTSREQHIAAFAKSHKKNKRGGSTKRGTSNKESSKKGPLFRTALTMAIVFLLYNQQIVLGQIQFYISPGDAVVTPQIIEATANNSVGPEPKVIIPKINVDIPVVYGLETRDERAIQDALIDGVVHYPGTARPGQIGNSVILGHSSNGYWNSGDYKFAFVLLSRLEVGDTFILNYEGTRYIYEVFNKRVVEPSDFSVVSQETDGQPIATLITCTPPGTSWKRLAVQAQQISPSPEEAEVAELENFEQDENAVVPGNTPSIWDRIRDFLFGTD